MDKKKMICCGLGMLLCGLAVMSSPAYSAGGNLVLKEMGIFYAGGETVPVTHSGGKKLPPAGKMTQIINQATVHYLIPAKQTQSHPVVMVPGLGCGSYIYISTPDGREGWAQMFARQGFAVYVVDEPTNSNAGMDVSLINAAFAGDLGKDATPTVGKWDNESIWPRFGFGESPGKPYEESQYPSESINQLLASFPTWQSVPGFRLGPPPAKDRGIFFEKTFNSKIKAAGLVAVLEKTGPAIVVAHSASGMTAAAATRLRPDLVKGLVMIEQAGAAIMTREDVTAHFADKPYLAVYGDYMTGSRTGMKVRLEQCRTAAKLIKDSGGKAAVYLLPEMGIAGNSHFMMQAKNNGRIAELIIQFLIEAGK